MKTKLKEPELDLHESWVSEQQRYPHMQVAAFVFCKGSGNLLVKEQNGVWTLPMLPHNGRWPGLMAAISKLDADDNLGLAEIGGRVLGRFVAEDPERFVAVVKIGFRNGTHVPNSYRLVADLEELKGLGEVDQLVIQSLATALPDDIRWQDRSIAEAAY